MARKNSHVKPSAAPRRNREIQIPPDDAAARALEEVCPRYADLAEWHVAEVIYRQMENAGDTANPAYKLKDATFPGNGLPTVSQVEAFIGEFVKHC